LDDETKLRIRNKARKFARLCDETKHSMIETIGEELDKRVYWKTIPSAQWAENEFSSDRSVTLKRDKTNSIYIFTKEAGNDFAPAFAAAHEVAHLALNHLLNDKLSFGSGETRKEMEANYFALVLLHLSEYAVNLAEPAGLTKEQLVPQAVRFISGLFPVKDAVIEEFEEIDRSEQGINQEMQGEHQLIS